ncbi:uncharacterized protein LOC120768828 [Bactrocera tryoni]|uniref:uncharacterized protein LOC120768828 n=1 Tax=Bactrocera tryoni TaxID=59916 RepID=UPI001A96F2D9|nr:uncharacterized protein LOC120768828 [Bactrocera tryoni]
MATDSEEISYVSLKYNKHFKVNTIGEDKNPTYPKTWFAEKKSKPVLTFPKNSTTHQDLRNIMKGSLNNTVEVAAVLAYARYILAGIEERIDGKWESYGVVIGEDRKITPLDLVKIEEVETTFSSTIVSVNATEDEDRWIMTLITGVYRVEWATDETYKRNLMNTITNMAKSHGMPGTHFPNLVCSNNRGWVSSSEHRKLMALIDMFFFRYDQNEWAFLRTGTIGSRFKDCAALLTYNYASSLIGLTNQGDLLLWIFDSTLAEEAVRLFEEGEEYGLQYSYFPYQVDFGLCTRSAYSARMNPAIHCFGNIIGAMMAQMRSFNARMILQANVKDIISNAQLLGFVFATRTERNIQFLKHNDPKLEKGVESYGKKPDTNKDSDGSDSESNPNESIMPSGPDPLEWFTWYDQIDGKPNREMRKFLKQVQDSIQNVRPGSIGETCKGPLFLQDI